MSFKYWLWENAPFDQAKREGIKTQAIAEMLYNTVEQQQKAAALLNALKKLQPARLKELQAETQLPHNTIKKYLDNWITNGMVMKNLGRHSLSERYTTASKNFAEAWNEWRKTPIKQVETT